MEMGKAEILRLFNKNVRGKSADLTGINSKHDGKEGHWLERQFEIKANGDNAPDINGYELKNDTTSKTTFGDWSANRYIYTDEKFLNYFDGDNKWQRQDSFLKIFGQANKEKGGRHSWSGTPCPKICGYNEYGQKLEITNNKDIVVIYNYSNDMREDKSLIVPKELQCKKNLELARWFGKTSPSTKRSDKCLKDKLEDKFNKKGWFKCKKNKNNVYEKICFGRPIDFDFWIDLVEKGIVFFDSGMYEGNKRPYSQWRAYNTFWDSLIIEEFPNISKPTLEEDAQPNGYMYQTVTSNLEGPAFPAPSLEESRFTIIDLFAGIGGIRLAFQKQGGRTVFSSEFNKFAQETYRVNYGEIPSGDITKINAKKIPDHDVLLAGFPCQPFSQAGLKKGLDDTRGTLFFDIARILEAKRPKAFMLENVKQLRSDDGGRTLATMLRILDELGYYVPTLQVLRSCDFRVPQSRERIIIVGFRRDLLTNQEIAFKYPQPTNKPTRVGDILEKNVLDKYTISDKLYRGHLERKEKNKQMGKGFGFSMFNEDSPYTNTISARYHKDGSEALIDQGEGKNPRKLTPRECARLQGFPEEFIIPVSDVQAYIQFGNSVTVTVIEAIAEKMIEFMDMQNML